MNSEDGVSAQMADDADSVATLVAAASAGSRPAWNALVDRYSGLVWGVARSYRLSESDAADVSQTTWLLLLEHIDRLHHPERVAGWLATTARRECLRILGHNRRVKCVSDSTDLDRADPMVSDPDAALIAADDRAEVQRALATLPPRWRQLITLLMRDPEPSYEEISHMLEIPIGSIGPTRGRSLRRLRDVIFV